MIATRFLHALLFALAVPASVQAAALDFSDAWIREAPPGAAVLAGYVAVRNDGDAPLALEGARSDGFERVELHDMSMVDGVMRMRPLPRVELAAGARFQFAPGATHLMLMRPRRPLRAGEKVTLEFTLSDGSRQDVEFEVRAPSRD